MGSTKKENKKIETGIVEAYRKGTNLSLWMSFVISLIILLMINDYDAKISLNSFIIIYIVSFVILTLILYGVVQLFIPFVDDKKLLKENIIVISERKANAIGFITGLVMSIILSLMVSDLCSIIKNYNSSLDVTKISLSILFITFAVLTATILGFIIKLAVDSGKASKRKLKSKKEIIKIDINTSIGTSIIISVICSIIYSVGITEVISYVTNNDSSYLYFLFLIIFVLLIMPQLLLINVQTRVTDDEK